MKKALSIKQPWALLIARGIKNIENRTWRTQHRGRIYIHASGSHGKRFNVNLTDEQMIAAFGSIAKEAINGDFLFGAIIGHVDIIDCVINHDSIWAEKTPLYTNGMNPSKFKEMTGIKPIYNWVLSNAVLYDEPILDVKGKLSLWDCSEYSNKIMINELKYLYKGRVNQCQIYCNGCNKVVESLNVDGFDREELEERFPNLGDDVEEFCPDCCYPVLDDENYLHDIMMNIDKYTWYDGVLEGHIEYLQQH